MSDKKIFSGYTVVEFSSILAGPSVGLFFAELGATVIKIENKRTGGDPTRKWKLEQESPDSEIPSAYYTSVNRLKNSVFLDLTDGEDHQQAMKYVNQADIVITNFKPSFAEKFNVLPSQLIKLKQELIVGEVIGYQQYDKAAFDVLLQAETGYISMTGSMGRPAKMPVALIDILAAHQLKEGILCALLDRAKTGRGNVVTVSLFDSAIASLANQASNYLIAGHVPEPMETQHPNIAPYGDLFFSQDGVAFVLAVGTERQWSRLKQITSGLGKHEWNTNKGRLQDRQVLCQTLQNYFSKYDWSQVMDKLDTLSVPVAPVKNLSDVLNDEYVRKNLLYSGGVRQVIWALKH